MLVFNTPKEVVAFRARDGQVPFEDWLNDLKESGQWRGFSPGWRVCDEGIWAIANRLAKV